MPERSGGPLRLRLALAFVAVAVLAVGLVAGLSAGFSQSDISTLVHQRRVDLTRSLAATAAATYATGRPGWSDVDLEPALDLARSDGADVAVLDVGGHPVFSTLRRPVRAPGSVRTPIVLGGRRIGTLVVEFTGRGLVASADNLRSSLLRGFLGAAGLAVVLALLVALAVSQRISRPVRRLIGATRALSAGDRAARAGPPAGAPAELRELASAFDAMADTIVAEERLRRDLVADVAHELRTPVAVLQANCEALLDGVVDHTVDQTASLHEEVLRLGRMVDELQTLAAAEAAALHLRVRRCDLADVAAGAVEALAPGLAAAGLRVSRDFSTAPVDGDPDRLHQVVTNLVTNSRKFTPAGGCVAVSVRGEAGRAVLEVADTGVGIAVEDQDRIFQRHWRGTAAATVQGTGVGLAVVAELVRAHRGEVAVTSEPGRGTTVTVRLPGAT